MKISDMSIITNHVD